VSGTWVVARSFKGSPEKLRASTPVSFILEEGFDRKKKQANSEAIEIRIDG